MKKTILQIFICIIITGCTSYHPETITVYYWHGFVDTSRSIPCSEMQLAAMSDKHSEMTEYDRIMINHKDFARIKNYMQNMRLVPQGIKTEIPGIDSRITVVYDTLAVSFKETYTKYGADANGRLVYGDEEVIYTIKSLSGYYNFFTKSDLLMWFPEIKKHGVPPTYKHIVYEKHTHAGHTTMPDTITHTSASKIIFVDGGE